MSARTNNEVRDLAAQILGEQRTLPPDERPVQHSIPSTLDATVYVDRNTPKKCAECGRATAFFEGCARVECPQRARVNSRAWE